MVTTVTSNTSETATRSGVFHWAAESLNIPKTAPEFLLLVKLKNPGMTETTACEGIRRMTNHLLTWSATKTRTAMSNISILDFGFWILDSPGLRRN
jgi:hypothetical protein